MIDVENQIFTPIAANLREDFNGISVTGEYIRQPATFPHVSIVEQDNYITLMHLDSSEIETYATVMYEVNVYSNKTKGKKSEAKDILSKIDKMMYSFNFIRTSCSPVPNLENATIYRLTARYEAETDGQRIFRR